VRLFDFPASLIGQEEDLVLDLRPHWVALLVPVGQGIGILLMLVAAFLFLPYSLGPWPFVLVVAAAAAAVLWWPGPLLTTWVTSHFVVTTDRVIRRSGLIAKESVEISLERISDIRFHQSVIERLAGAGDLIIQSAAGPVVFHDVRAPERVQRKIFELKEQNDVRRKEWGRRPESTGFWKPASLADELAKLHSLREKAIITEEEFRELKALLLARAAAPAS
jgi:uncharacterized membrane protein YdbT with pleckstrin-like domain